MAAANYLAIFIGGGLGATARFVLSRWISQSFFTTLPLGTLVENVLGSLLMGFLFYTFEYFVAPVYVRLLVTVGFIGAFTTFSTYTLETVLLVMGKQYDRALLNVLVQNTLGLVALVLGIAASGLVLKMVRGEI